MSPSPSLDGRFGVAWSALAAALAAHVIDEAATGFLELYNPIVRAARTRVGWFPMPLFTFDVWVTGLAALVAMLFALAPLAFRRSAIAVGAAYPFGVIMLLNGVGHLAASVYLRRWAPGATTAPLLVATSIWLLATVRRPRTARAMA